MCNTEKDRHVRLNFRTAGETGSVTMVFPLLSVIGHEVEYMHGLVNKTWVVIPLQGS